MICGRRERGRPKTNWLQNPKEWLDYNARDLLKAVKDRHQITMTIFTPR